MTDTETPIGFLRRRLATMKTERSRWEPHWRDCANFALPQQGQWFAESPGDKGVRSHQKIINSTATRAIRTLKAGFMSNHTNPARPWFRLITPDPDMMEVSAVKQYLFLVERRMQDVLSRSNFYAAQPSLLEEMAVFGQCPMLIQEDLQSVARFFTYTIGSYWLAANDRGEIDTLVREFKMTVRNVLAQFGEAGMSDTLRNKVRNRQLDEWVDITQFISPNQDMQYGRADYRGMAYKSCYFESASSDGKNVPPGSKFLKESGYRERPFVCPRWDVTTSEDVYGNSVMMDVLGDVKQLQFNERRKAAVIDKLADPNWTAPTALKNAQINLLPGGVTFVPDDKASAAFRPAYEVPHQAVPAVSGEIAACMKRIQEGFFQDLLLMLSMHEGPQMTAEEIIRRQEEKVNAIGPYLTRLNSEQLDPMLDRLFEIMVRHPDRLLPPPPRELQGLKLKVDYVSSLAQAQRMVGGGVIERFASFMGSMAQLNAGVLDKWDMDQTIDQYANVYGVPPDMVRSDDQVAQLRQQREQMNQMQQTASMAQPMKDAALATKALTDAQSTPDSVLGRLAQGAAAAQGVV